MLSSYKNMPKEVNYLVYAAFLPSVAYGMFYTDISFFLTTIQGVSIGIMGLAITLMGVSTFIASVFLGTVADVYGRKKLLIIGNVLASIILIIFALTTDPITLLTAAILEGISEAAVLVSSNALLADKTEDAQRNSAFSMYGFVTSIAFGLGSIIIYAVKIFELFGLSSKASHVLLYIVISIFGLASTLIMLKVSESKRSEKLRLNFHTLLPRKSKGVLIKYALTGAIIAFGAGMFVPLMTLWFALQYGISDAISGLILGISSILVGVGTLVAPALAKKLGLINAIVVTQLLSTVFMFVTPFASDFALASILYSIRALLMNMASPLQQSMIMGLVVTDERGAASGISGALWRLPNALSTFVGAWLLGLGILYAPFLAATVFYLVSILLFRIFFGKVKMPEEKTN